MVSLLINYADQGYFQAQKLNTQTGLHAGKLDRALQFGRKGLDGEFRARNHHILQQVEGAGAYLWKPYIVSLVLHRAMNDGDVLFYCDSGSHFVDSAQPFIERCLSTEKKILLCTLPDDYANRKFAKRDTFFYMGMDRAPYIDQPQILSGYFACQKTPFTVRFFDEWLQWAQDARILSFKPGMQNACGLPNYPDFFEHRFDQSILSLIGRKYDIATVADISQYGNDRRDAGMPQIIGLTRWKE